MFSKHCVCAQLVKEELSRSAVLAATFELGMPQQMPIYWPIFHKDCTLHLCSSCWLSTSGPDSKHWLLWRSLCWFVSQPSEELPPRRPKPVCSKQKLPAACQWQQYRIQNSDQGDFNSINYLLNQMDLVWKYLKHLHFQGFPTETRWASCKNTPKQIHPENKGSNLRPSSYFCHLIFTNIGVSKKVTKFSNSRVYWLKPSQPPPCTPINNLAALPDSVALNTLLCPSSLCICSQQECMNTHNPCSWDLYGAHHCCFLDLHNWVVQHGDAEATAQTALAVGEKIKICFCTFLFPPMSRLSRFSRLRCVREKSQCCWMRSIAPNFAKR